MAYNRTYWVDHVTDKDGKVIQQGTLLDQQHFNNMEVGLSDLSLAHAIMAFKDIQKRLKYEAIDFVGHSNVGGTFGRSLHTRRGGCTQRSHEQRGHGVGNHPRRV